MQTYPVTFSPDEIEGKLSNDFIPITHRYNSLADVELNYIAGIIKAQNLENQMNMKLMGIKHNLSKVMAYNY